MTLRVRLVIATAVAVLCGLAVVDVATYLVVTRAQLRQVDDALIRAHSPIEQLAQTGRVDVWAAIPQVAPGLYVAILDPTGTPLFTSAAQSAGNDATTVDPGEISLATQFQTVSSDRGHNMRVRVDPLQGGSTLVVGQSLKEVDETRGKLLAVLLTASAAAIALVALLSWTLVRIGLRPLRRVEQSAAEITDSDLGDRRVPGDDRPTEVGSLARALNAMLDRLDSAKAERERTVEALQASESRMRRFVADASHELRTPIAATAAYAELFDHGARNRPEDLERTMTGIRNETKRMSDLVNDLLLLARLDEHRPLNVETVDLTELLLSALETARTIEPDRRVRPIIDGIVSVPGDPIRLRQVIDNLLANVRAHTPADTPCTVRLRVDETGSAELSVSDTGPGVTAEQLALLTDRFYRVDDARTRSTGGSGLGLSIVEAIIGAHGGAISAAANAPSGLVITIRLPNAVISEQLEQD